jgi:predicted hotdog family 3-hydroxylacyl-ACP dehydratase
MSGTVSRVPVSLRELLPHTGTARLVTAVLRCDEASVAAVGEILAAHPLVRDGQAPAFLAIELGAQAAAVMEAMTRRESHETGPVHGRLVRVRDAQFVRDTLPVDTPLDVTAHVLAKAAPLAVYRISVRLDGVERVTATLSTYATGQPVAS